MRGSLRFYLATLVVTAHMGYSGNINIGVSAVIVFYMLAGYVVTHLLNEYFPPSQLLKFYAERLIRIFPLYITLLATVSLFLYLSNFDSPKFTLMNIFANLTIVPLNYFMYLNVNVTQDYCVLPPTWSLAAELQAYLLLPLVVRHLKMKWIVGIVSLCFFTASAFQVLDPDIWGYRLIPGTLYVFLTGSATYRAIKNQDESDYFDRIFPIVCWSWLLLLLLSLHIGHRLHEFTAATILGFLIGLPIVRFTSSSTIRLPFDSVMGTISYGLFLIHMPVAWFFEYIVGKSPVGIRDFMIVMIASSLISAGVTFPIDHFTWPLRKSLTSRQKMINVPDVDIH